MDYNEKIGNYGEATVLIYPSGLRRVSIDGIYEMMKKARQLLLEGDYIQACEKFYKAAEETIKILAELYAPETMKRVKERIMKKENPWDIRLLYEATKEIAKNIGEPHGEIIRRGWRSALDLHRDCFHEFLMTDQHIKDSVDDVETLFNEAKKIMKEWERNEMMFATINTFPTSEDYFIPDE